VEQNIWNVNILLTCADNRNKDKASTFMDGGPLNRGWGSDLTACLVRLRSHSRLCWGHCLIRAGPKCVCFWPPVPNRGPVRHEIPISSPPLDDIPSIP
jgi:hypothetical protein